MASINDLTLARKLTERAAEARGVSPYSPLTEPEPIVVDETPVNAALIIPEGCKLDKNSKLRDTKGHFVKAT